MTDQIAIAFAQQMIVFAQQMNEFLSARIEMEGMIAENKQREVLEQSMAYGESDFIELLSRYDLGCNSSKPSQFYK